MEQDKTLSLLQLFWGTTINNIKRRQTVKTGKDEKLSCMNIHGKIPNKILNFINIFK